MSPIEEMRVQQSAAKARGYFEQVGRGLLITEPVDHDEPFQVWMRDNVDTETQVYRNRYVSLDDLKATECPVHVVRYVETYDPHTEAVLSIQFDPDDCDIEPRVVPLGFTVDPDGLPF
jgi:hypothetical protein